MSYKFAIILRAIILNTHVSREAPKTHGLTYVFLAQNFGITRRISLVKFCTPERTLTPQRFVEHDLEISWSFQNNTEVLQWRRHAEVGAAETDS